MIAIGRCMKERLTASGVSSERIHVIHNWADTELVYPVAAEDNRVRTAFGWSDKFVVLYAGNIGFPQYFDDLLEVAGRFRDEERVLFAFVGAGGRVAALKDYAKRHGLSNIQILPFLHESFDLAEILSAGDVHFVTLRKGIGGLAVPSKSYGILAAGRPIIYQGDACGEIALMVVEEQIGCFVPCERPELLYDTICEYLNKPQRVDEQGTRARRLAQFDFGRTLALEAYEQVIVDR